MAIIRIIYIRIYLTHSKKTDPTQLLFIVTVIQIMNQSQISIKRVGGATLNAPKCWHQIRGVVPIPKSTRYQPLAMGHVKHEEKHTKSR